jgi:putative autoinducer-2 (AI-2) aldolase
MDWGMSNRLARILGRDGRAVMLAVDHGYFMGPTSGLEEPRRTIAPLLPFADSIMLTRGVLRTSVDPAAARSGVVLRVSGGASILRELSNEDVTVAMEDALRLGVSAVALSIFVGAEFEKQTLVSLARLVDEGQRFGMPVLAVTAVGKDMARDARYLGLACRIAAEQGAHLVKTYCCEDFESVVRSCPVPIIVAGGKKTSEREALDLTFNAVSRGAVGVDMGRNIFQSTSPVAMIRAVRAIVHDQASAEDAFGVFEGGRAAQLRPVER